MTAARKKYIEYLEDTLIPDLKESGSSYTEDFENIVTIMNALENPMSASDKREAREFIEWLDDTLIPDTRASGRDSMAYDLRVGVNFIKAKMKVR